MAAIAPARIALAWRTGPRARPGPRAASGHPPAGRRGELRADRGALGQLARLGPGADRRQPRPRVEDPEGAVHRLRRRRPVQSGLWRAAAARSEEHTSELQSLMRISYAVFCLKKKKKDTINITLSPK